MLMQLKKSMQIKISDIFFGKFITIEFIHKTVKIYYCLCILNSNAYRKFLGGPPQEGLSERSGSYVEAQRIFPKLSNKITEK
ncbi:MAG: hypothetical protein FD143_3773 [Ignavibacteria bacterium]|nr:MAG: hypothetical protein FD143_3773 [Ignavibacteria bacterium]